MSLRMSIREKLHSQGNDSQFLSDIYENTKSLMETVKVDHRPEIKDIIEKRCTLINPAPPARYLLRTRKKDVDGRDLVRRWTIGAHDPTKRNKTLLLLGEVGAGKTSLTNMMVNVALGIKWDDDVRFQVTDGYKDIEKRQIHDTQTKSLTAYDIFGCEEGELPFSLTIIDTPGIEGRNGLRPLVEQLRLLLEEERVDQIDAVCHVVKASQNRLTQHQRDIFDAFASLLGKDMNENIFTLITHSDGTNPEVVDVIVESKIYGHCEPVCFTFNNHLFQSSNDSYDSIYKKTWESGVKTMKEFFDKLNRMRPKRTSQTVAVLRDRLELEDCGRQTKVFSEVAATCCPICEQNCHVGCNMTRAPYFCKVMLRGKCTVCALRCGHTKHIRDYSRYADNHKTLNVQITECYQNLRMNALKPNLRAILKSQFKKAKAEGNKDKLLELEEKKKIIAEIVSDAERYVP